MCQFGAGCLVHGLCLSKQTDAGRKLGHGVGMSQRDCAFAGGKRRA